LAAIQRIALNPARQTRQTQRLQSLFENLSRFEKLYQLLGNEESKNCMIDQLVFSLLGPLYCRPFGDNQKYQQFDQLVHQNRVPGITMSNSGFTYCHNPVLLFEFKKKKLKILSQLNFIYEMIFYNQYWLVNKDVKICAAPGDYVIDCGAGLGDNTLLFAQAVGLKGHVYAFECSAYSILYLRKNLNNNPYYGSKVSVHRYALTDKSGEQLSFKFLGGGTSLGNSQDAEVLEEVTSITIDDFVAQNNVPKVDFIKMDIEGAERLALHGARETIRRFRPKLAISIYHLPDDYVVIAELIADLLPDYTFYMAHHSSHFSETILYCIAAS